MGSSLLTAHPSSGRPIGWIESLVQQDEVPSPSLPWASWSVPDLQPPLAAEGTGLCIRLRRHLWHSRAQRPVCRTEDPRGHEAADVRGPRQGEAGERQVQDVQQGVRGRRVGHPHQLRHENEHIFEEIGTNKMFSIKMIGIGEEDRGQGVATNLIRRSILLAGCLGFRAIKTEATGRFSKETIQRVGMQPAGSIKYDDFVFDGKKPFAGMKDGNSEITFMKKKFFQSS